MLAKVVKDGTYKRCSRPGARHDFALASMTGVLHFVNVTAYGMATVFLGARLGTSIGYAIFVAFSIMVADALGL